MPSRAEYVDLLERVFTNGVVLEVIEARDANAIAGAEVFRMEAGMTWRVINPAPSTKS